MHKTRRALSDEERAERRRAARAFAAQAVEQLRPSEVWKQRLAALRLFTRTALQPAADRHTEAQGDRVTGFRAWLKRLGTGTFLEAAEGTRTLDLLHGKQTGIAKFRPFPLANTEFPGLRKS